MVFFKDLDDKLDTSLDLDHQDENDQEITGINITPLVDVMLVLLVIFMVTASYIVNASVKIDLPQISSEASGQELDSSSAVFLMDEKSAIYYEGQLVDKEQLGSLVKSNQIKSVIISADKRTPHGDVMDLLDRVKQAGVVDFSVDVEVKKQ